MFWFLKNLQNTWTWNSLRITIWKIRRSEIELWRCNVNDVRTQGRTFWQTSSISVQNLKYFLLLLLICFNFFNWYFYLCFLLLWFDFNFHFFLFKRLIILLVNLKSTFNWPVRVYKRTCSLHLSSLAFYKKIIPPPIWCSSWSKRLCIFWSLNSFWNLLLYSTCRLYDLWNQVFSFLFSIFIMLLFLFNFLPFRIYPFFKLIFFCRPYSRTHVLHFTFMLFYS